MLSEQIRRLEEKIAYLERHVVEQDKAMLELSEELNQIRRDVTTMRLRLSGAGGATDDQEPGAERPPHY